MNDIEQLIAEVSLEMEHETREQQKAKIKNFLLRGYALVEAEKKLENELKQTRDKIAKNKEKLERFKSGDWSVVNDNNNQQQDKTNN